MSDMLRIATMLTLARLMFLVFVGYMHGVPVLSPNDQTSPSVTFSDKEMRQQFNETSSSTSKVDNATNFMSSSKNLQMLDTTISSECTSAGPQLPSVICPVTIHNLTSEEEIYRNTLLFGITPPEDGNTTVTPALALSKEYSIIYLVLGFCSGIILIALTAGIVVYYTKRRRQARTDDFSLETYSNGGNLSSIANEAGEPPEQLVLDKNCIVPWVIAIRPVIYNPNPPPPIPPEA